MGPLIRGPFHIVGSVTQLYRSCSIRDTRADDYRRRGREEEATEEQAIAESEKSEQKNERTNGPRRSARARKGPEGKEVVGRGGGDQGRERCARRRGRKMCGREVIRRNGAKESALGRAVQLRSAKRGGRGGWELNGPGS